MSVTFIFPAVAAVVFITGCIGNGTLVFIFAKYKAAKTYHNAFFLCIAIADMLLAVFCTPIFGYIYGFSDAGGGWIFGEAVCKIYGFVSTVSPTVSIFTITAMAFGVCIRTLDKSCTANTIPVVGKVGILFALWFVPCLLGLPNLIFANVKSYAFSGNVAVCFQHPTSEVDYPKVDTLTRFIILYVIPFIIIAVSFTLSHIFRPSGTGGLYDQRNSGYGDCEKRDPPTNTSSLTQPRYKVLILSLAATYMVCWLPFYIYMMWFFFDPSEYNQSWYAFRSFAICLSIVDSCVRPWFVFGLHPTFNHYFKKHFCCCFCRRGANGDNAFDGQRQDVKY